MEEDKQLSEAQPHAGGRKPLWDELDMPSMLDAVRGWAKQGSLDKEICEMLDISYDTFYKWKREKPEFAEALKKGRHVANGELLNSAFTQATGYTYMETQVVKVKDLRCILDKDGKPVYETVERVEIVPVQRFALPNPTMNIFMLKNRLPKHYRDKHEVDVNADVKVTGKLDLSKLSDEELDSLERILSKSAEPGGNPEGTG